MIHRSTTTLLLFALLCGAGSHFCTRICAPDHSFALEGQLSNCVEKVIDVFAFLGAHQLQNCA